MFLDPGIEIMSTILNSQARKTGLGKEKYASRPAQGRKPGLERKKYTLRPVRFGIYQISIPANLIPPLAFRYPT